MAKQKQKPETFTYDEQEYIVEEMQSTESHKSICRVFEIMTGLRTDSTDEQDIKRITR